MLERGWSEKRQAYAQSFDSDELDAAQLLMPILGFLPATDDPRMRSTIEAIARELTEDGLVLRYRNDEGLNADGLTGEEGTFVICSFWLVSCLAQAGEVERARGSSSTSSSGTRTTSDCWPRRSTRPRRAARATSRRRSATSG